MLLESACICFYDAKSITSYLLFSFVVIVLNKDGACSFPPLWEGEWYDSLHGDITLNGTISTVAGWVYNAYNQPVTPFTCVSENSTSNQLLFM